MKTAALNIVEKTELDAQAISDIAYAFQDAAVDTLVIKCKRALVHTDTKRLVVAGGVGANIRLREQLDTMVNTLGGELFFPRIEFCTDNGAMIALAGSKRIHQATTDLAFQVKPRWSLEDLPPV